MGTLYPGINLGIGTQDISFAEAGVTPDKYEIVQKVGNIGASFDPKEPLNSLTSGFELNGGYIVKVKQQIDAPFLQTTAQGVTAAPTNPVVNDTANTFNWTHPAGFTTSDEETTVDGGSTWVPAVKPLVVGNVDKSTGTVGVRVKAITGRSASSILYNTVPFVSSGGSGGSYDADADAYFTRATAAGAALTPTEKNAYNTFVLSSKVAGYYSKILDLKIRWGNAALSKLNAVDDTFPGVWVGGMTYVKFGVHGNGTDGYEKSGFIPATHFPGQFNYSYGAWMGAPVGFNEMAMGATSGTSVRDLYLLPKAKTSVDPNPETFGSFVSAHSQATSPGLNNTSYDGMWVISRTANNALKVFRNGSLIGSRLDATETSALPSVEMYHFGGNVNGALNAPSATPQVLHFLAAGLTDQESIDLSDKFSLFLQQATA